MKPCDKFGQLSVVNIGVRRFDSKFAYCVCKCGIGLLIDELTLIAGKAKACGRTVCRRRARAKEYTHDPRN